MRPVLGLRPDRSSKAALLALAAMLVAATPAWASAFAVDQIDGLIAAGAIALAAAASLWACALLGVAQRLRRQLQRNATSVRAAVAARDALLGAARDPVAVWDVGDGPAWSYGGAEAIVQSCLAAPEPTLLVALPKIGHSDVNVPADAYRRHQFGRRQYRP